MVYLLQTEIIEKKSIVVGLQKVFGIGRKKALIVCLFLGLTNRTSLKQLTQDLKHKIVAFVEKNYKINDELKQVLVLIKEQQKRIKCYKGQRARFSLPCRGQRTHTNAKTVKKIK
jgi:small subunit ribosomal protein S13